MTEVSGQKILEGLLVRNGEVVANGRVYVNNRLVGESSSKGSIKLAVRNQDSIQCFWGNFSSSVWLVPANDQDTIRHVFELDEKVQQLEEVRVERKQQVLTVGRLNEHLLDYELIGENDLILLKKRKNQYFLSRESFEKIENEVSLNFKPESFFQDYLGNFHILSKDSIYQVILDLGIGIYRTYPIGDYKRFLQKTIAGGDHGIYAYDYSHHNQRFYLLYKESGKATEIIYYYRDSVAELVARKEYNLLLSLYHASVPEEANIILNGFWTGDVVELMNVVTKSQLIWYRSIRSLPLNIVCFDHGAEILLFDLEQKKLLFFDKSQQKVNKELQLNWDKKGRVSVQKDPFSFGYYLEIKRNGSSSFFEVNLGDASLKSVGEKSNPEHVRLKIRNGFLYYLYDHNSFRKLSRRKL
ncbi:MAG: hypothetical protein EP338_12465 [Bacteroidetes bacterium]|nr:MAG: hypothetical protein EP338_12465 [Bacteroidota bacterium]